MSWQGDCHGNKMEVKWLRYELARRLQWKQNGSKMDAKWMGNDRGMNGQRKRRGWLVVGAWVHQLFVGTVNVRIRIMRIRRYPLNPRGNIVATSWQHRETV